MGGLLYPGMCAIGVLLSGIEWWTRGRYHLGPPTLALAICTLLLGLTTTTAGLSMTMHAVGRSEKVLQDSVLYKRILSEGIWESLGALTASSLLAALQIALWGVARRRVLAQGAGGSRTMPSGKSPTST